MPPNVILVLLDTARAGNFSSWGYKRETTPFIDSLADDGVQYRRAFSNSIYSLPSYASIFTGEYPSVHGAVDWSHEIDSNRMVDSLNAEGYETHAVSTHLVSGEFGIADSFDTVEIEFVGSRDLVFKDDPVTERMAEKANRSGWNTEREKYHYFLKQLLRHPSPKSAVNGTFQLYRKIRKDYGYWSDDGASKALATARKKIRTSSKPFFLFLNFVETHDPYRPPRKYIRQFIPDDVSFDEIRKALEYSSVRACLGLDRISKRQRKILLALYDAELRYLDDQIREFYEFLKQRSVAEDTVFVVVSDHGDFFGKQGLWGHQGRVYNDVCHVPLIIKYPWESSHTEDRIVELRQLCDHIRHIGEGEETTIEPNNEAIVEYYGLDTQLSYTPSEEFSDVDADEWESYQCALLDEDYKLIWDTNGGIELYDMQSDLAETKNLAEDNPDVVKKYQDRIISSVGTPNQNHRKYRTQNQKIDESTLDDCIEERLRELGYVE